MLDERGMKPADLAREGNIGKGTLSDIFSGRRKVGPELATSIADGLDIPPLIVFQEAGLLPRDKKLNPQILQILHELDGTTKEEQEEYLAYLRFMHNRKKK